ncbi:MAG: S9 family peptidase [Leptolyngbyaceae bacterium]|nr:S9 family peptidase [Leptolyngbyaceae bacterium]
MTTPQTAPYGTWKSPITSDLIVAGTIRLGEIRLDGEDVYWLEGRPQESGRYVVVRRSPDGTTTDITPPDFNVRTRVHEYGGGAYIVDEGTVYFSNFSDQRLYRQPQGQAPQPLTPELAYRYADAGVDASRNRLICVREDHTGEGEAVNTIVAVSLTDENSGTVLVSGADFYASPRLSPDGSMLAWISWNHPDMPWDGTTLWVADVRPDGAVGSPTRITGSRTVSIFQPEWSPDGMLYFVGDRTDWWNLYCWNPANPDMVEPVCPKEAEFGLPQWVFTMSTYGFESAESLICTYIEDGVQQVARLNTRTSELIPMELPYSTIGGLQVNGSLAAFSAGSTTKPGAIATYDLSSGEVTELRRSSSVEVEEGYLSIPVVVEFPTTNDLTAYGFYYPPTNKDYVAPEGEAPPLLVKIHGGPTAATSASLDLRLQYWTSRGIAILDVNYGGSTGYGREYRERLKDNWGIVDVDDCVNGAKYLVEQGKADGDRLMIDGGSAGGYTTLAALTFRDTFKAGASYYGVSDAEALAQDTHKFESRYLDSLIGPYPEQKARYVERSPIHFTDQLACPVIFFQGDEDKIVPPNQAEMMVDALKAKGLPVAYVLFEGEQHGFRKAENIKRALDAELYFYSRVFGFELAEAVDPVEIENLG